MSLFLSDLPHHRFKLLIICHVADNVRHASPGDLLLIGVGHQIQIINGSPGIGQNLRLSQTQPRLAPVIIPT